ncbi:hypothetical protein FIBSPDRAFT_297298 [Athelia psychrophila]|uniref:Uncharacterized protein n=1 Tax=Athelia psychrophila TaxID=1759441 RepID=A0A167X7L0_9AGAM|nr:hypothetical protein FIBSPDRAFT_297298 [Fibularhizoctonia sp. CBS 109695]
MAGCVDGSMALRLCTGPPLCFLRCVATSLPCALSAQGGCVAGSGNPVVGVIWTRREVVSNTRIDLVDLSLLAFNVQRSTFNLLHPRLGFP